MLFAVGIIAVFRDLAEPDADIAVAPEIVQRLHGLEKGFTGEFLCQVRIAGEMPQIAEYIGKVGPVELFEVCHFFTSSYIRLPSEGNLTRE